MTEKELRVDTIRRIFFTRSSFPRCITDIFLNFFYKLILKGQDCRTIRSFIAPPDVIERLDKYIGTALERMIPVITFEDPDEKFLFKEKALPYDGAFCSKKFWKTIFGGVRMKARFCVTNKRLLFYHVDPYIDNIRRRSAVNFGRISRLSKKDYREVAGILRGLMSYKCFQE